MEDGGDDLFGDPHTITSESDGLCASTKDINGSIRLGVSETTCSWSMFQIHKEVAAPHNLTFRRPEMPEVHTFSV